MATPRVHATIRAAAAPQRARPADEFVVRSLRHSAPTLCSSPGAAFPTCSLQMTSADSFAAADHLMREGAVCTRLCDAISQVLPRRTGVVWLRARALGS